MTFGIVNPSALRVKRISQDPTVTAGAYSSGDAVGGLLTFAGATGVGTGEPGSILESVTLIDEASQAVALDLVLFTTTFTPTADNSPFDPSDAVLLTHIGTIRLADYATFNDNAVATKTGIGLAIPSTSDGAIYGQLVTRGTPTYDATGDISVIISVVKE